MNSIKRVINILSSKIDPSWNPINYIPIIKLNLTFDFRKLRYVFLDSAFPLTILILEISKIILFGNNIIYDSIH